MTITVAVLNEAKLPDSTIAIYVRELQNAIALLKTKWTLPDVTVTTVKSQGAWEVSITNLNRRTGADGWHNVSPTGLAYAYITPGTLAYPFGTYRAGALRRLIGKTWFPIKPEYLRSGCLTVLIHETLEMLVDPALKTVSTTPDKLGHNWLIEVCSTAVFGTYFHHQDPVTKQDCVLPNFAFPSAFDLNGKALFDYLGVLKAPFTTTPKSYPYWVDKSGKLIKV